MNNSLNNRLLPKPIHSRKEDSPPPPRALVFGNYMKESDYSCFRSSGATSWLILYTRSGKGIIRDSNQLVSCSVGDLLILPPGVPHDYFTADNSMWEFIWAHFFPRENWGAWQKQFISVKAPILIRTKDAPMEDQIHKAFMRLGSIGHEVPALFKDELGMNAIEEIMLLVSVSQYAKEHNPIKDLRVLEVLNFISDNAAHNHSIEDLAKMVCLSPSRLAHLFKEQVGDSIINTLLQKRLQRAAKLLQFTPYQITEIAMDVGFSSPDYFTRTFTSFFGISPSKYRQNYQSHD
jgi:AraC family transcriptional regulator, arabinose operon regulatory protein